MDRITHYIKLYFNDLFYLSNEMSPYLLLGFLFAGILHVYFKQHRIVRYLGQSNARSAINASLIGVPLPLCSCGVIPTGVSFYKNGASKGSTVSFLISTPQTGVDSILATYSLLGLPFAILRPVIAFISGILGGMATNLSDKSKNQVKTEPEEEKSSEHPLKRMFRYAFVNFMQDIANWLIIGLLVAALFSVLIPDDFFTSYIKNEYLGMLIVLGASIPLYVCATGSIPIAAVLMMKGLSPGAALVFLMAGPATNAATITVLSKVLGKRALISYLGSIIGGALLFGILINHLFPKEWFLSGIVNSEHHVHFLPEWFKIMTSILLLLLIINAYLQKKIRAKKASLTGNFENHKTNIGMEYKTIVVKGMTCNHCKATVEKNLTSLEGIQTVSANPDTNEVMINGEHIDLSTIEKTVNELGYEYRGEK